MKLDCITVAKILRCFRTRGCRKWRNRFKNKKIVVLVEYFEQRQIAADIEEKWANEGEVFHGGISHIYLSLANKWKPYHGAINSWPRNLRTALEKCLQFQWIWKQLRIEARQILNGKLWYLFPDFLWNYTYNFENIFTEWSKEG